MQMTSEFKGEVNIASLIFSQRDRSTVFPLKAPSPPNFLLQLAAMQVFGRRTANSLHAAIRRQGYSTAAATYASTAENLRINRETKVIYQGFTGKQGR